MPNKTLSLIGAAQGWGAAFHEVEWGPLALYNSSLVQNLQKKDPAIAWRSIIQTPTPYTQQQLDNQKRLEEIQQFSTELANEVRLCHANYFPVVLGGDHSVAIGTWSGLICALKAQSAFGLIWIDAHMDSHTPQSSPSQNIHGMPLATLLGYGNTELVNTCEPQTKLNPNHVVLIGIRSFEAEEAEFLKALNVKIYYMEEVNNRGFEVILKEAIDHISKNTKGFGITIDMDAFDPSHAPGTGTKEHGGLEPNDVIQSLEKIKDNPKFNGLEIVEFDPSKDENSKTEQLVQKLILSIA